MIPIAKPSIGKEEERAVAGVLKSGRLAQGKMVERFEEAFAKYCGTKYAIATDNGTSALIVALLSAGIGPGDEVITTPFTFIASANSILFAGAKLVFVDIDPDTFNIDPNHLERAITKKTKAILPVHLYGLMADMSAINKIARKHRLIVIEDSAQAHGANIKGKRAGSWGLAGCFSFYPTKNMTTGEGGMITTSDEKLEKKAKLIRNQGMEKRYYHDIVGYNFRMTDIAAAIGVEQLEKLEAFTKKRIENAAYLTKKLKGLKGVESPTVPKGYRHVFHQYTIRAKNRRLVMDQLEKSKIGFGVYYPLPVHKQKPYKNFKHLDLSVADKAATEVLSLPINPSLSKNDLEKISLSLS
jgi:dTDP-4-amino-4,6-dideoxygalactose transaminase